MYFNEKPVVTVLLPAYNASAYIVEAIESVLNQTYSDFELLIINDGSKDDTEIKVLSFSDKRIRYEQNDKNEGLVYTLNKGLELARGVYIARMDADDICLPTRLEKQVNFLNQNIKIDLCGTNAELFGDSTGKTKLPLSDYDIRLNLLIGSCIIHPTVMFRCSFLRGNNIRYRETFFPAEDYRMWVNVAHHGKMANIEESLLKYRVHNAQISIQKKNEQTLLQNEIQMLMLHEFSGSILIENEIVTFKKLVNNDFITSEEGSEIVNWINKISRNLLTERQEFVDFWLGYFHSILSRKLINETRIMNTEFWKLLSFLPLKKQIIVLLRKIKKINENR